MRSQFITTYFLGEGTSIIQSFTHLCEEVVEAVSGVEGVFLRKLSKKLTPLDIRLEKFRLRLRPKRGLQMEVKEGYHEDPRYLCVWWSSLLFFSSFLRGPGRVL